MTGQERILPVGIQSFVEIRRNSYLYVNKANVAWQLVNKNRKYNYLSRLRRFGKSILVDTLACYLSDRKELFEGLKIMVLEKKWVKRPVIRLDMSRGGASAATIISYLNNVFLEYEQKYGAMTAAVQQIADNGYLEPFKGGKRKVIGIAVELDDLGKGVIDWQVAE